MSTLRITAGPFRFTARLEEELAPKTCAAFRELLPYRQKLIHARWSGEACWIPLGEFALGVGFENHTSHPAPGDVLFYPGGYSETELLIAYGPCSFASRMGPLAGNHFMTLLDSRDRLRAQRRLGEPGAGAHDSTPVSSSTSSTMPRARMILSSVPRVPGSRSRSCGNLDFGGTAGTGIGAGVELTDEGSDCCGA